LPSSLQHLTFGHDFNQIVDHLVLPTSVQQLTFGHNFNQYLHKIEIECYLVENYNLKDFKAKYLDTWILMQNSNIIRAFEKNISNFNYKENDEILAFIKIINISLNQLA